MQRCGGAIDAWEVGADVDLLRQRSTLTPPLILLHWLELEAA
jgi:hypothetical protein